MSDSNAVPSFRDLMNSAAADIPDKKKVGAGRYKFRCLFSAWEPEHTFRDGSTGMQFRLQLQPVLNLDDMADDLANAEPISVSWTNRSPEFVQEELRNLIKAHGFRGPFAEAVAELKGRFYVGSVQLRDENINIRKLMPAD